ncbi:MAG: MarR family transcriptional regulator [Prolixibacteraceae bacterium]|nr:MarR family transcriptional regulator [Prolixibacteraceae bacterium]MBN2650366.1 MarR family transcriptional regulator [Prolixibacteraceae bacterium]
MNNEQLRLENQLCFPVYAASRLITREYQPYFKKLGITYPQYLVFLVLWENDGMLVNAIAKKLILNTNTITPLLKRMEQQGFIVRKRLEEDERKVYIQLTPKGKDLKKEAAEIPKELSKKLMQSNLNINDLVALKETLNTMIQFLSN